MTYIKWLTGKEDDFVKLRQVAKEVIDAGSLGGPPAVSSLYLFSFFSKRVLESEKTYIP